MILKTLRVAAYMLSTPAIVALAILGFLLALFAIPLALIIVAIERKIIINSVKY